MTLKVLWFTNTACSGAAKLGLPSYLGGWLTSLEENLRSQPDVHLGICFYHHEKSDPFTFNGVDFFPVERRRAKSKLVRWLRRTLSTRNRDKEEIGKLLDVVSAFKPDLIHVHGTEDNFGMVQEFTAVPAVVSIQGLLSSIEKRYYAGIPRKVVSQFSLLFPQHFFVSLNDQFKVYVQNAERERKVLSRTRFIMGRTAWDKSITRLLAPSSEYFSGNELLRRAFYGVQWRKACYNPVFTIVTVTSDNLYKGLELIVETARVLSINGQMKFIWKVIGINQQSKTGKLVRLWKKITYEGLNIDLCGMMNEVEVRDMLVNGDLFCQVSHIENSSNSLCEAMLVGMPIVAVSSGGTQSILAHRKEGIITQNGDPYSLAADIVSMYRDLKAAAGLGLQARLTAMDRHKTDAVISDLIAAYKAIIAADARKES